tara:strand:+ start:523 stop:915 length:393 start_codon:yes stop_codon:yes gene_type:complete
MTDKPTKKELREFGFVIGFAFPLIIGWFLPFITNHPFRVWTLVIGIIGLIFGLFIPRFLYYPYKFWMKIGLILGWVNSRIILGLVFIFVLQPIAIIMKVFKYDPLNKNKLSNKTYRESTLTKKIDLKRIF